MLELASDMLQRTELHCVEYIKLENLWLHARDVYPQVEEWEELHINQSQEPRCQGFFSFCLTLVITTSPSFSHLHCRNFSVFIPGPFIRDRILSLCLSTFYKGAFDKRYVKNQSCKHGNITAATKSIKYLGNRRLCDHGPALGLECTFQK